MNSASTVLMEDFMATGSSSNRLVGISTDTLTKLFKERSIHPNLPRLKLRIIHIVAVYRVNESIGIHSVQ